MPHERADEEGRVTALGLFHRTISEVEDAILHAKARQAYRTAEVLAGDQADIEEQGVDLNRWLAVGSKPAMGSKS
ncbi:hypothetical protein [Micromonospora sp. CPCC 205561]|uniref:hypothetical protein n=1 Tax=Micromonospora sp. CPCC 205561 TaxID=3122407 RepID=UPI002FF0DE12